MNVSKDIPMEERGTDQTVKNMVILSKMIFGCQKCTGFCKQILIFCQIGGFSANLTFTCQKFRLFFQKAGVFCQMLKNPKILFRLAQPF